MKGLLLLVALAALSVSNDAAEIQEQPDTRVTRAPNLSLGYVGMNYRLLYRQWFRVNAVSNTIQFQDVTYRGNANNQIAGIRAFEESGARDANAALVSGGLGGSTATVRLTTGRGSGFNYRVEFWGR